MAVKHARAYRENCASVVGDGNGTVPPDQINETRFVTGS